MAEPSRLDKADAKKISKQTEMNKQTNPAAAGMPANGLSRVILGVVSGIGFLGAGAILKSGEQGRIRGGG